MRAHPIYLHYLISYNISTWYKRDKLLSFHYLHKNYSRLCLLPEKMHTIKLQKSTAGWRAQNIVVITHPSSSGKECRCCQSQVLVSISQEQFRGTCAKMYGQHSNSKDNGIDAADFSGYSKQTPKKLKDCHRRRDKTWIKRLARTAMVGKKLYLSQDGGAGFAIDMGTVGVCEG